MQFGIKDVANTQQKEMRPTATANCMGVLVAITGILCANARVL